MSAGAGTSPWHLRKRSHATMGYRPKQYRGVVRGGRATGYMMDLGQRHQNHVRGCGMLYGKNKPTPTAVLYNKRIHQNEPITVAHDIKQELRSEPGSQAVVTMIAERLLPRPDYSGGLLRHVNRTTYDGAGEVRPFHLFSEYMAATHTGPTQQQLLNHRRDWTMGTNAAWRDGYAIVNGALNTENLMEWGYATPFTSDNIYGDPTRYYVSPALAGTGGTGLSNTVNPTAASTAEAAVLMRNYYHLYEEISWKIQNNSVTGTTVTIYECVLNRDIPLNDTLSVGGTVTAQWAGMPCPLELWRQSQELRYAKTGYMTTDGDPVIIGLPINGIPIAEDEGAGAASAQFNTNPSATSGAVRGMDTADIDYPNVRPDKASLLHTYYKVRAHTRYLPPGADTTITIGVRYNKRIPGAWWNSLYGVAGHTRAFFMVNRPDEVVGITGGDGNPSTAVDGTKRIPVMNATDLMVSWTKKKTVCRVKQRTRVKYWFKAAIPNVLDVAIRNPITLKVHDADVFMGEDADEPTEGPGA